MSFEVDGYFSPEIDRFREAVRSAAPFKAWFDYALGLNRVGYESCRSIEPCHCRMACYSPCTVTSSALIKHSRARSS